VRPLGDRILIEPLLTKEATDGGIVTPEAYRQRDVVWRGIVISKGSKVPSDIEVGHEVFVNRYSVVVVDKDGEKWVARTNDILAIINGENRWLPDPDLFLQYFGCTGNVK
jgi:co-chaperonin GroES (HSP10)